MHGTQEACVSRASRSCLRTRHVRSTRLAHKDVSPIYIILRNTHPFPTSAVCCGRACVRLKTLHMLHVTFIHYSFSLTHCQSHVTFIHSNSSVNHCQNHVTFIHSSFSLNHCQSSLFSQGVEAVRYVSFKHKNSPYRNGSVMCAGTCAHPP